MSFLTLGIRSRGRSLATGGACLLLSLGACEDAAAPVGGVQAPQAPQVVTWPAADILDGQATLHGSVNPYGTAAETWFQFGSRADAPDWGTFVDSLAYQTAIRTVSGNAAQEVSVTIGSLWPATTYYFRVVARNDGGTRYGVVQSFVTVPALPSGAAVAFVRGGNIYVYSVTEGRAALAQLTTAGAFEHPAWSPDARRIAFASSDSPGKIYVMDADGSGLRPFAEGWSPAWSPDGRQLAFSAPDSGGSAIFVRSVDDPAEPTVRIGFDRGYHDFPTWSPDGSKIAFVSDWEAFDLTNEIYIANADGSGSTQVTHGFSELGERGGHTTYSQPSWSPDGRSLALLICEDWQFYACASSDVGVLAVDGSGLMGLAHATGFARPTCTADGSGLLFSRTCRDQPCQSDLFQVGLDGKERLLVADAHSGVWRP
jgi:dipeptidyl aminopeptidase/acylaminoacyl peptidase